MGPLGRIDAGFLSFLRQLADEPGAGRLVVRNFLLDEGVVADRAESYRGSGAAAAHPGRADWGAAHGKYLQQQVFLDRPAEGTPAELSQDEED